MTDPALKALFMRDSEVHRSFRAIKYSRQTKSVTLPIPRLISRSRNLEHAFRPVNAEETITKHGGTKLDEEKYR